MSDPFSRLITRAAYGASQLPRVAWYVGHGLAMRKLSEQARREGASTRSRPHTDRAVPDRRRLFADMAVLFQQDLANVEAGIYPLPADHDGSLPILLDRSRLFFEDLPEIHRHPDVAAVPERLLDLIGEVEHVDRDLVETVRRQPAHHVAADRFACNGDEGLRDFLGERVEAGSFSAGQDNSEYSQSHTRVYCTRTSCHA